MSKKVIVEARPKAQDKKESKIKTYRRPVPGKKKPLAHLNGYSGQLIVSPHFADPLHGRVGESVVGLTGISATTTHAAPTHEVIQRITADSTAHLVHHPGGCSEGGGGRSEKRK